MNNPFQLVRAMQNPQQLMQTLMGNAQLMRDPRAQRAMSLIQTNDTQGLKEMAENMCREYGVSADDMKNQIMQAFGIGQ